MELLFFWLGFFGLSFLVVCSLIGEDKFSKVCRGILIVAPIVAIIAWLATDIMEFFLGILIAAAIIIWLYRRIKAEKHWRYGNYEHNNKKDYWSAVNYYTKAINISKKAKYYYSRGNSYLNREDYDAAIEDYTKAINISKDAMYYNNRGHCYFNKKDYDAAIEDYTKAINISKDAMYYNNRGHCYFYKKDYDKAIEDHKEAINLRKDAVYYGSRGHCYFNKKDYDKAIEDYTKAIEFKKTAKNYKNRAKVYKQKGDYNSATKDLEKAMSLACDYSELSELYTMRSKIHLQKGAEAAEAADNDSLIAAKYRNLVQAVRVVCGEAKETFTDPRDGNKYKIVKIGEQIWMAENLNCVADGSACYGNNPENCKKYGRLYNWAAAKEVCPPGWHLPSDAEWDVLVKYVDPNLKYVDPNWTSNDEKGNVSGFHLKAKYSWEKNGNGQDTFGFSALAGGWNSCWSSVGGSGYWWSATEYNASKAWDRSMRYNREDVKRNYSGKDALYSVRCLRDTQPIA
ncbi:MAG: tetratricopeptide repeat protein [Fibromonadales bacterium]|nr:tetratricopeptide repeat protein [Fibromonadales bacterium]